MFKRNKEKEVWVNISSRTILRVIIMVAASILLLDHIAPYLSCFNINFYSLLSGVSIKRTSPLAGSGNTR